MSANDMRAKTKGINAMGLRILTEPNGEIRPMWYAQYSVNGKKGKNPKVGKRITLNLHVPVEGKPPRDRKGRVNLDRRGDVDFERSRRAAEAEFLKVTGATASPTEQNMKKIVEIQTNKPIEKFIIKELGKGAPLSKFVDYWKRGTDSRTELWKDAVGRWFNEFNKFAQKIAEGQGRSCETINDISHDIAEAWVADLRAHFSKETVARQLYTLRATFARYMVVEKEILAAELRVNPFDEIKVGGGCDETAKPDERRSRKPLTEEELARLFKAAQGDSLIFPLVVCAACTGMRLDDVCHLRWESVDLANGIIDAKTHKTGSYVSIPIFDRLREVLEERRAVEADGSKPSEFVFPKAAKLYETRPKGEGNQKDTIIRAIKHYLAEALFVSDDDGEAAQIVEVGTDGTADATEQTHDIRDALGQTRFTEEKRNNVLEVYERFKRGEKSADIANALNISRPRVSMYLADAELLTGERLRPVALPRSAKKQGLPLKEVRKEFRTITLDKLKKVTRGERKLTRSEFNHLTKRELEILTRFFPKDGEEEGNRANTASLYGWHSLRATFVVLAIEAGVPLASVQKIVGHSTFDMTMQYYNPTRLHEAERVKRQMRNTILNTRSDAPRLTSAQAVPSLTHDEQKPADALDALLAHLTDEQKAELLKRLAAAK